MCRSWDFETKTRPAPEELKLHLEALVILWPEIIGAELAHVTRPLTFTGLKARRPLVVADADVRPPWGGYLNRCKVHVNKAA
jgi:hypothetical protein